MSGTRPALLIAVALTLAGSGLAYWLLGAPPLLGAEDAAIGFRYARNLAEGHGIVFNPGGERVEGFTSLSWLFISAAVYAVTGPGLESVLLVVSAVLTVVALGVVVSLLLGVGLRVAATVAALTWLASQGGFYFWSALSLMDVAPWAAGLTVYLWLLHRAGSDDPAPRGAIAATVTFLALTRPEASLVVPATALVAALAYGVRPNPRRAVVEAIVSIVVVAGALTLFRLVYFGFPLPNTYYTKVPPDLGYRLTVGSVYVLEYLQAHPLAWLPAAGVAGYLGYGLLRAATGAALPTLSTARRQEGRDPPEADEASAADGHHALGVLAAGLVVSGIASIVYGGGDHYQGHRFVQAYVPAAALPLALMLDAVLRRAERARPARVAVTVLVVGGPIALLHGEWTTYAGHGLRQQAINVGLQGRYVGSILDEAFSDVRRPELGLWMVGGAGYTYTGPVKDLLGLNWIAMGTSEGDRKGPRDHAAFNVDVFWSAPPELMLPEPEVIVRPIRCIGVVLGGVLQGMLVTERFRSEFEPVRIRRGDAEPLIAYARSDWIGSGQPHVERLGWAYCDGAPGDTGAG